MILDVFGGWGSASAAGRVEFQYDGSLASAGNGVRGRFQHGLFGYVELAKPLTRLVAAERAGGDNPRVFFVLRWDL